MDYKIKDIEKKLNLKDEDLIFYGEDKAKIKEEFIRKNSNNKDGKLVLVTAITPTKSGEGKTATTIGLVDGLNKIGIKTIGVLREPSMGPVFGLKGGAVGGGKETIEPQEDINLHFTGDIHALTSSINLISAVIDNHIFQGNELRIDPKKILWKRSLDVNDRILRKILIGLENNSGILREESFQITVANELMAVLCLSKDKNDFKERVNKIIIGFNFDNEPIYLKDLKITNAIMKLMKYALLPNLVQTCNKNPILVHGGPFANIAHGCNSLIATKLALKLANVVVTEAGFGSDLGAEKFFDIKCKQGNLKPDAVVLVTTIRALKYHGGQIYEELTNENLEALNKGYDNLKRHCENLKLFKVPFIISINKFSTDSLNEINDLIRWCKNNNFKFSINSSYLEGQEGAINLANKLYEVLDTEKSNFEFLYKDNQSIEEKIDCICKKIYHANKVIYSKESKMKILQLNNLNLSNLQICIAKTQYSFSDNAKLLNAPTNFDVNVKDITISNGAGFIVVYLGNILTMPGLPKIPNAILMEK